MKNTFIQLNLHRTYDLQNFARQSNRLKNKPSYSRFPIWDELFLNIMIMGSGKRLWGSFRLGKALSKISYYSVIPSHWDPWSYHKEGWIGSKNIIDTNFCFCSRSSTKFQIRLTDTGENVQKWTRVFSTRRWVILVARTRRKKERKIACPLLDAFACGQVSSPRLYRLYIWNLKFSNLNPESIVVLAYFVIPEITNCTS